MKANARHLKNKHKQTKNDEAVSPVIAVILMVAITVVLAATVYVWVSGFASEDSGPEQASATARGFSSAAASGTDWIRVTLVKGENAPYGDNQVNYTLLDPNGNSRTTSDLNAAANEYLCTSASSPQDLTGGGNGYACATADEFHDGSASTNGETWDVGEVLYMPCQTNGDHSVTITVRGTTVLDTSVKCDGSAN